MFALSTIANLDTATKDSEGKHELRLTFSVPKSEENLRGATVFENQGSKQSVRGDLPREIPENR
jgi:hypothetical protein